MSDLIPKHEILKRIHILRGQKILIDRELAQLYGVETRELKQQVKRNINRLPSDFMFELTKEEKDELITKCDHLTSLKYSSAKPLAFTEHGALMLSIA